MNTLPVGSLTVTFRSLPVGVLHRRQRQGVEIVDRVAFLLPAVGIQKLAEIALLVEQAQADQRIVLVARGLQMVAGEDAQAAGIDRQALGEAVLGGEIGDQLAIGGRRALAHAGVVGLAGLLIERQVARVGGRPFAGWPGRRGPASARDCSRIPARAPDRGGGTARARSAPSSTRML